MDLPTCPSCGQSVLDDDAQDCPFCGASMSGAPVKRKPAPPPATAGKSSVKDSKKETPARSTDAAAGKRAAESEVPPVDADNDDPFAVDASSASKAVPLRPKPVKGRTYKLVCPMCETPGYTSTKAGGREVRCCNPDCLVPVFTAPEFKREKPPEEPVKKPLSKAVLAAVAAGLLLLIAVGMWFFVFREDPNAGQPDPLAGAGGGPQNTPSDETQEGPDDGTGTQSGGAAKGDEPTTPAAIRKSALETMVEASRERDNRRKSFCRRLTAEAFAITGDVDEAQKQLAQISSAVFYYRVQPLVKIAWRELASGDSGKARQTLDLAMTAAKRLPNQGRAQMDAATELATALAATGRFDEARTLIAAHQEPSAMGQLSADLSITRAGGDYNLDAAADEAPIFPWNAPQIIAVTRGLAARGHFDAARQWAEGQTRPNVRSEAVVIWADSLARRSLVDGKPLSSADVEQAASKLSGAGRARLYARLASRHWTGGRKAEAEQFLKSAGDALSSVSPPAEFTLPDMKGLVELKKLPDAAPFRMRALAAAEIALAQSQSGRKTEAWAACELALKFLRGSTPGPVAIGQRVAENEIDRGRAIRDQLKVLLELENDDMARLVFNEYRRNCDRIKVAADNRFALEEAVLIAAARWGLLEEIWEEIGARRRHSDINLREPWLKTRLPWMIVEGYEQTGNVDASKPIQAALRAARARRPAADALVRTATSLIDDGRMKQAAKAFEKRESAGLSQGVRDRWRLRLACRLIARGEIEKAFEFVRAIRNSDAVLREDTLRLIAAQATRNGQGPKIWKIGQRPSWTATEVVSIYRGVIEAQDAAKPASATADTRDRATPNSRTAQSAGS